MKHLKKYFSAIVICVIVSCNNNTNETAKKVEAFADIECRAMALKDKRFALANEIRFTQDTLMQTAPKDDTLRLHLKLAELNKQKESILQSSLALADSIHLQMEDLMTNTFKDKESKAGFDKMLDDALKKRGCK